MTGFWVPFHLDDPLASGSLGAGLLLEPGVYARAVYGADGVTLVVSGEPVDAGRVEPLSMVIGRLGVEGLGVLVEAPAPLAVGYGVSAAVTLAAALAVAAVRTQNLTWAARLAHAAEVVAGTGLGDVIAEFEGRMLEVRLVPGAPGIGRVESLPIPINTVVTVELGRMHTREMHARHASAVAVEGLKALTRFLEEPRLESFLEAARDFSIRVGFAPPGLGMRLDKLVARGHAIGWYVKKKLALIVPEEDRLEDVVDELKGLGLRVRLHRVAREPAVVRPC